jgi:hypothetical protein
MEFEESLGNSHHREDRLRRRHRHAGVAAANGDVTLLRIHSSSVADASALGQTHLLTVRLHRTAEYPAEELAAKVILPPTTVTPGNI